MIRRHILFGGKQRQFLLTKVRMGGEVKIVLCLFFFILDGHILCEIE